jgi:hypothetical protein
LVGFKKSSISIGIKDAYEEDKDGLLLKRDLEALLKVNPPPQKLLNLLITGTNKQKLNLMSVSI